MDGTEGRVLRNVDLSLKRMVFLRKLEAPLDLRVDGKSERGSVVAASPASLASSRSWPEVEAVKPGEGMPGSIE